MPVFSSVTVQIPPGDNTGLGMTVANIDARGLQAVAPAHLKQDGNLVHDKELIQVAFPTAPAAGGLYVWSVPEGFWQLAGVIYSQGTASTSGTIDVQVCSVGTAANAGTTQLTAVIGTSTAGNNSQDVTGTLIATPTTFGPGNRLSIVIGGTPTGMVGTVSLSIRRVA